MIPTTPLTSTSTSTNTGSITHTILRLTLALTTLTLACTSAITRPHPPSQLLAAGQPTTDVSRSDAAHLPSPALARAPDEVLRDPAQRMMFLERMRVQVLHRTRRIPPADYQARVRPSLDRQLRAMGLEPSDVAWILEDVDRSRSSAWPAAFGP